MMPFRAKQKEEAVRGLLRPKKKKEESRLSLEILLAR